MEVGSDDEERTVATFRLFIRRGAEVMVEGAFGGFVEFFGVEGFVRGGGFVFWGVGCWLDHWHFRYVFLGVADSSSLAFE